MNRPDLRVRAGHSSRDCWYPRRNMWFSVGLKDLLFGERVTVTVATRRGPIRKRVTVKWLQKVQAEGMGEAVPVDAESYVLVHVLDVDRGYSTVTWKVNEDIPAEVFRRLRDPESGELFVVRANDSGVKRSFGMQKAAWEALRDQPWSPAPSPPLIPGLASAMDAPPRYSLPLKVALGVAKMSARRTAEAREATPAELVNATPRFNVDRSPFWSRIFLVGAAVGAAYAFTYGQIRISIGGVLLGLLIAFNYAGYAALVVALIPILVRLYSGARIHRLATWRRTRLTVALYRKSTNVTDAPKLWPIGLASVTLLTVLALFVGVRNVLGLSCFVLVTVLGMYLPYVSPPGVLFLGASSPRALDVLAALRQRMTCRVAALLDTSATISAPVGDYLSLDNFRASDHSEWRGLVAALKDICVVTVLDTAAVTEHVLFEASETFRRLSLDDVVFVSDSSGRFPVLERLHGNGGTPSGQEIYAVHPSELDIAVRSLLWNRVYNGAFPRLVQPATLGTLLQADERDAPRTGYLEIEIIRANSGTISELEYCEGDRTTADENVATT